MLVWGEEAISCHFEFSFLRKGATRVFADALCGEPIRWIHPASPHARYMWWSQPLALFSESFW